MTVFAGYGDIFTHWLGLRMWDHSLFASLGPNRNVSILCRIEWNKVPRIGFSQRTFYQDLLHVIAPAEAA